MFLGKQVPACGLSLGLERILVVMEERGMSPATRLGTDLVVAPVKEADLGACLAICQNLRDAGLRVDLRPKGVKPGKLRQYAQEQAIAAAAWMEPGGGDKLSLWTTADGETTPDLELTALIAKLAAMTRQSGKGG